MCGRLGGGGGGDQSGKAMASEWCAKTTAVIVKGGSPALHQQPDAVGSDGANVMRDVCVCVRLSVCVCVCVCV